MTNEAKHTSWTVESGPIHGTLSVIANAKTRDEQVIASVSASGNGYAHAKLLAAAPALLAALRLAAKEHMWACNIEQSRASEGCNCPEDYFGAQARAAIAQATGEKE